MRKLSEIKRAARALTSKQMMKLDAWLHELIAATESKKLNGTGSKRQMSKELVSLLGGHFALESISCGKKNCRCAEGELHCPYWYAYWIEGGKPKSQYIGKRLCRGE
jgi:hypothetical protein